MKTVIEMAGQAFETPGTEPAFRNGFWTVTQEELERFAELVRADERARMAEQPAQRTWVGLTKQEFNECVDGLEDLEDCWTAIEAKLKEKNT